MSTYVIIGGDGKEYGPVSAEELRQWYQEGRLNGQSLVKSMSDAEFRPLIKFPEFALIFQPAGATPDAGTAKSGERLDYELDLSKCISAGMNLVKTNFGLLFGATLVLIGCKVAVSILLGQILAPLSAKCMTVPSLTVALGFLYNLLGNTLIGPVTAGVCVFCLRVIRGLNPGLGETFDGFRMRWSHLFLGAVLVDGISNLFMSPANIMISIKMAPFLHQMQDFQPTGSNPEVMGKLFAGLLSAYGSCMPVLLVCLVPVTYFWVCWQFTLPLILDRGLRVGEALKFGWKRVHLHWWHVFGLSVLAGLIGVSGLLACGVGIFFTLPIGLAILMHGYETIFPSKTP